MNHEIKEKWIEALESGDYQQGRDQLRYGNNFCCLGVLCDLAVKAGHGTWRDDPDGFHFITSATTNDKLTLPQIVQEWAGLKDYNPCTNGRTLCSWNDEKKYDFDKIARLIKKFL